MGILIGSIVLLSVLLIAGTWIASKLKKKGKQEKEPEVAREVPSDCCGAHEICEYDERLVLKQEIIYYNDEELDRFKGINDADYSDEQIDEIRDVLYTLRPREINSWLKSIEMRGILLPSILNIEARQLIADEIKTKKAS